MISLSRLAVSVVAVGTFLFTFATKSDAGPTYNCKSDRRLDVPMQFTATLASAGRLQLSATGGADKSGWVAPMYFGAWRLYDATGRLLTQFTESYLVFASLDMLKSANVEGLMPDSSYTIELTSQDICGNTATVRKTIRTPAGSAEANAPVLTSPDVKAVGALGTSANTISFTATDDTGLARVAVYVDGILVQEFRYFNGVGFRWWTDFYPQDNYLSSLEGPNYFIVVPEAFRGRQSWVEVVVEDPSGNQTRQAASLYL